MDSPQAVQNDSGALIVTRIGEGDALAESALVDKYYKSLHFILMRRCNNDEQLAADIAQDAFIMVINKAREKK